MSQAPKQGDFFPEVGTPEGTTFVNTRCLMRTQDGHRVVMVSGVVIAQYALGDRMAEAHAMVSLIEEARSLLGELNATATTFPGTNLILRYDVAEVRKR